jgi:DNA-binding MarR family transcriptional regulator
MCKSDKHELSLPEKLGRKLDKSHNLYSRLNHVGRHAAKAAAAGGEAVPRGQGRLLRALVENDGMSQRDILDALDIRPSSASELIAKLEQGGYVTKQANAEDKRVTNIFITEKGREYVANTHGKQSERVSELFDALDENEQQQLSELLGKLVASLKEKSQNAGIDVSKRGHSGHGGHGAHGSHGPHGGHAYHGGHGGHGPHASHAEPGEHRCHHH